MSWIGKKTTKNIILFAKEFMFYCLYESINFNLYKYLRMVKNDLNLHILIVLDTGFFCRSIYDILINSDKFNFTLFRNPNMIT